MPVENNPKPDDLIQPFRIDPFALRGRLVRLGPTSRFDVRGNGRGRAGYKPGPGGTRTMIRRWPWGYASGGFDGCGYLYGDLKIKKVGRECTSNRCRRITPSR